MMLHLDPFVTPPPAQHVAVWLPKPWPYAVMHRIRLGDSLLLLLGLPSGRQLCDQPVMMTTSLAVVLMSSHTTHCPKPFILRMPHKHKQSPRTTAPRPANGGTDGHTTGPRRHLRTLQRRGLK